MQALFDYIGLTKGDLEQNRKVFDLVKDADAIDIPSNKCYN
jgi:hypothetical protein